VFARLDPGFASLDLGFARLDPLRAAMDLVCAELDEREIHAMNARISARMPLSEFLLDANRLCGAIVRHRDRLNRASGGRITEQTAHRLRRLADEILQVERERVREVVPPIRPLVREAEKLVSTIAAAAKIAAVDNPLIGERQRRAQSGPRRRSANAVALALETHLGLVREHSRELAGLVPDQMLARAQQLLSDLQTQRDAAHDHAHASSQLTARRDAMIEQLQQLLGDTRAVAAVIFRDQPEIAREFARQRARGRARSRDLSGDAAAVLSVARRANLEGA